MAIDTSSRTDVKHYKNYIGGEWVDAASGETFDVINPATEEVIATVAYLVNSDRARLCGNFKGARFDLDALTDAVA